MVGVTWKGARSRPSLPSRGSSQPPPRTDDRRVSAPSVSFRDKIEYQDLFKPLPKPEPIPQLTSIKIETKSWKKLQEEREALVDHEIERTRKESETMWNRARTEDTKRVADIQRERDRIENETRKREELMRLEMLEREEKDRNRKEEIRRQDELLSGRKLRAKTTDPSVDRLNQGLTGIQIYHYKDPAVADILKKTREEEIRRRASQPDTMFRPNQTQPMSSSLADQSEHEDYNRPTGFVSNVHQVQYVTNPEVPGRRNGVQEQGLVLGTRSWDESSSGNLYRSVMEGKEFFKGGIVDRSQSSSSSSTTSR